MSIPNGSSRNRRVLPTRDHPSIPFTAPQLYKAFEGKIGTAGDLDAMMADLEAEQRNDPDKKRVFAYRGVANANHAFFSSLYRRLWWTEAAKAGRTIATHPPPTEYALAAAEDRILVELHRWGLHDAERGRLSVLRQLAVLQHNHAPTRLIDVSLNIWVALWFAVEQRWADGQPLADTQDGRLFAIDITDRLINEDDDRRDWEDTLHTPWGDPPSIWTKGAFAWQPSPADRRMHLDPAEVPQDRRRTGCQAVATHLHVPNRRVAQARDPLSAHRSRGPHDGPDLSGSPGVRTIWHAVVEHLTTNFCAVQPRMPRGWKTSESARRRRGSDRGTTAATCGNIDAWKIRLARSAISWRHSKEQVTREGEIRWCGRPWLCMALVGPCMGVADWAE